MSLDIPCHDISLIKGQQMWDVILIRMLYPLFYRFKNILKTTMLLCDFCKMRFKVSAISFCRQQKMTPKGGRAIQTEIPSET